MATSSHTYILVTGANVGLGLGICHLLISDFLTTHPPSSHLTLLFTTRTLTKSHSTETSLLSHIATFSPSASPRIHLHPLTLELTSLLSISTLTRTLLTTIPHLNALILNAGIAGTTGINYPLACYQILTENAAAVTWPRFKRSAVGSVAERQLAEDPEEPPLGNVFAANVFGHYVLAHGLMGVLRRCPAKQPGRVIWMSSIEAGGEHFQGELMGARSTTAYECSKRVTDLLALTAGEDAERNVTRWMGGEEEMGPRPRVLLCHPGIVATGIVPLPTVLMSLWMGTAYVMRWLGSPWHTNTAGKGAVSAVWLALAGEEELNAEAGGAGAERVKWGSAVDRLGNARVEMTDVQGWGVDGSGEPLKEKWWGGGWGRTIGAADATTEDVQEFTRQGVRVWKEMEEMRMDWELRIQRYERQRSSRS